ncbi:MAG: carboxylesterase family protein [Nocardioides sp.]
MRRRPALRTAGLTVGLTAGLLLVAALTGCQEQERSVGGASPFRAATEQGEVRGFAREDTVSWRGIPYAAAPVGELRWEPPQPAEPREGTLDASTYGHACPQPLGRSLSERLAGPIVDTSEDCLYLNVTRPRSGDALPVMVWLHGGGFTAGTGNLPIYNSTQLARQGVVLVTLNYRLGRLGYFAHPALTAQSGERVANYGLLDQIAALEWVRDNIAAFGGDPDAVTVFGESAGGMSVNALMSAPRADGLFRSAISESGLGREPSVSFERSERQGVEVADLLGVSDATAAELRALPARKVAALPLDLLEGQGPIVDDVLPKSVVDTFEAGDEAPVPYVVGVNDLEVPDGFFAAGGRDPDAIRDRIIGPDRAAALAAYGDEETLDAHLMSDVVFTEPARHLALLHGQRAPTYLYRFQVISPELRQAFGGAPHAFEIPFVFGTSADYPARAEEISAAWVAFAATSEPGWPEVGRGTLVRFTNGGWRVSDDDPWKARLDVVESGYARGS